VGKNIDTYPDKIARFISGYDQKSDGAGRQAVRSLLSARRKKKKQETAESDKDMDLTFYDTLSKKKGMPED